MAPVRSSGGDIGTGDTTIDNLRQMNGSGHAPPGIRAALCPQAGARFMQGAFALLAVQVPADLVPASCATMDCIL